MTTNQNLHAFAVKWFDKFRDTKTVSREAEDPTFADECSSLGFKMDCGKAFEEAYSDSHAFNDYRELDKIIDSITDIALLGSGIFSKWRYFTHWAGPGENMLSFENRSWFITALGRLERLAADDDTSPFIFEGIASKIQIISNNICFGPCPLPDDKIEQHLSITANGRSNSDRIEKIVIDYYRLTKIKPGVKPEGATWEYATWDYSEHITIDRKSEVLEHIQNIGTGCQVSRKYHVEDGITSFLDDIDTDDFMVHTEGNPPDVIVNPLETKDYKITIDYLYGEQQILTGTFDKNGLPDDFADFAESIFDFMRFYGMGEILDSSVYGKPLRKQTDYIFCNVQFDDYGKTYCYLTDDGTLEAGDYVIVPTGKDNHEVIAQIESIEYHSSEDASFPLDKIKKVIKKHIDNKNIDNDSTDEEDSSIKLPEDAVIMGSEPLLGVSAEEWRDMLGADYTESALATSLAGAWNEASWLMDEADEDDCTPETKARYESWWALQIEFVRKVAAIMQCECKTPYVKLVTPFMERNGYCNGHGWWVKKENINKNS